MALITQSERKSKRWMMKSEDGRQVLAMHCSYEQREIVVQIERVDPVYCNEHPEDVQNAISQFINSANKELAENNMPTIITE